MLTGPTLAQTTQGQFTPDTAPIQLHMPVHLHAPAEHRTHKRKAKREAPAAQAATVETVPSATEAVPIPFGSAAPVEPPAPKRAAAHRASPMPSGYAESRSARRKAVKEVLAAPASAAPTSDATVDVGGASTVPFSFDAAAPPPPATKPKAAPPPRKERSSATAPKPKRVASLETPPKRTEPAQHAAEAPAPPKPKGDPHAGMTKKAEVLFAGDGIEPQSGSADALSSMAGDLNNAIDAGAGRIELEAFGGPPGDKSSDARRLSLRRALAIRQLLIDKGIPANRIDVKALGGIDGGGRADRVDIWLRGAS